MPAWKVVDALMTSFSLAEIFSSEIGFDLMTNGFYVLAVGAKAGLLLIIFYFTFLI